LQDPSKFTQIGIFVWKYTIWQPCFTRVQFRALCASRLFQIDLLNLWSMSSPNRVTWLGEFLPFGWLFKDFEICLKIAEKVHIFCYFFPTEKDYYSPGPVFGEPDFSYYVNVYSLNYQKQLQLPMYAIDSYSKYIHIQNVFFLFKKKSWPHVRPSGTYL
jgi:hypothetical protein